MKQIAVEWFFMTMNIRGLLPNDEIVECYNQAKAMEKEQIFEAWDNGFANGYDLGKYNDECSPEDAEQYYNETFKSE